MKRCVARHLQGARKAIAPQSLPHTRSSSLAPVRRHARDGDSAVDLRHARGNATRALPQAGEVIHWRDTRAPRALQERARGARAAHARTPYGAWRGSAPRPLHGIMAWHHGPHSHTAAPRPALHLPPRKRRRRRGRGPCGPAPGGEVPRTDAARGCRAQRVRATYRSTLPLRSRTSCAPRSCDAGLVTPAGVPATSSATAISGMLPPRVTTNENASLVDSSSGA
jgi:hypothetical protein